MKKENPGGNRDNQTADGVGSITNAVTDIKTFGHYCQELGFQGVESCDWYDCHYAKDCKVLRQE